VVKAIRDAEESYVLPSEYVAVIIL
jgi:hypothetical protein